jgi:hypothetical protein
VTDPAEYVREVEAYLCRRNGGHLVRVVGPAFELVRGWATTGVPLKVTFHGIDRCCERHEAKGTRRRPIRIEFCEADVLDAFDDWRRAVGVTAASMEGEPGQEAPPRKPALSAHLERVMARLAHVRDRLGDDEGAMALRDGIDHAIRELEGLMPSAPRARGEGRARIVAALATLDAGLMGAATVFLSARVEGLRREAAAELAPFAGRMSTEVRERATEAAFLRLVREAAGLPTLAYEAGP